MHLSVEENYLVERSLWYGGKFRPGTQFFLKGCTTKGLKKLK